MNITDGDSGCLSRVPGDRVGAAISKLPSPDAATEKVMSATVDVAGMGQVRVICVLRREPRSRRVYWSALRADISLPVGNDACESPAHPYEADDKQRKGPLDSRRINTSEAYEVAYWAKKFNCTDDELRGAVAAVGTSVAAVKAYFDGKRPS
jgi:hypothetical protein